MLDLSFNSIQCEKCDNTGYYMGTDPTGYYDIEFECDCMIKRKNIHRLKVSGLGRLIEKCTFENFKTDNLFQTEAKNAAEKFLQNPIGKWFYFGGNPGCGKTHICTAITVGLINQGFDAKYMMWRTDLISLKACRLDEDTYNTKLFPYINMPILYIDDLFKGRNDDFLRGKESNARGITDSDVGIAFDILNYRAIKGMTTIISSEFRVRELLDVDEAIGSRVAEMSRGHCVNVGYDQKNNYRLSKQLPTG